VLSLTRSDLSFNQLSGTIPENFASFETLRLQENFLTGSVPNMSITGACNLYPMAPNFTDGQLLCPFPIACDVCTCSAVPECGVDPVVRRFVRFNLRNKCYAPGLWLCGPSPLVPAKEPLYHRAWFLGLVIGGSCAVIVIIAAIIGSKVHHRKKKQSDESVPFIH
jgi:hypothetical protein